MTVKELREAIAGLPDDLEVIKATPDGLFKIRQVEPVMCDVWESGTIHETTFPEYEPEDEIRQIFAEVR